MGGGGGSLIERFAALRDPRQAAKVLYPLPEILLLLLGATLAGADDFVETEVWGERNLVFLRRFLPFTHGIPSHDTLGDVVALLDPALFRDCFTAWVAGLRATAPDLAGPDPAGPAVIALDGKTSRRSHARAKGREPLHLLSAGASGQRLVLGQEAVDSKSNEITAIPALLERLELAGALVTIDAIGAPSGRWPRPSRRAAATTCWRSRATGPPPMQRSLPFSPPRRRRCRCRPTPLRTATMAGSRSGAMPSAMRWTGCSPTAATRTSRASPLSP
jgi:predicted transposase YbfD/YdcC